MVLQEEAEPAAKAGHTQTVDHSEDDDDDEDDDAFGVCVSAETGYALISSVG